MMPQQTITGNTLYYGDNLDILREYIPSTSVDLIYLDPPFNSNRNYNVLFKDESGTDSEAQIMAFEDTWHWNLTAEQTYRDLIGNALPEVGSTMSAFREFIGTNQVMAYLVMMTARLVELHRVLKPTGSIYLHCDPTASHYLKIIMDVVFGKKNYRNEIVWHYNTGGKGKKTFLRKHDTIFWYSKTDKYCFNRDAVALPRVVGTAHLRQGTDEDGREYYEDYSPRKSGKKYRWYLDEGVTPMDVWTDIQAINPSAKERLGYPTQKPLALLERIITASSNPGDILLDPFCGCGTAIAAAQKLGRTWIGIDITHLSIALQKYRMADMFPGIQFRVVGEPQDIGAAQQLAGEDRYQFQWWALSKIQARPLGGEEGSKTGKKGSDRGIDGLIPFIDDATGKAKRVIVQVKSGHVKSGDIRDLRGTVEAGNAAIGVFITLEPSTSEMNTAAVTAGFYHSDTWDKDYPRIQILTVADLLHGAEVKMPPRIGTFKQAAAVKANANQPGLALGIE